MNLLAAASLPALALTLTALNQASVPVAVDGITRTALAPAVEKPAPARESGLRKVGLQISALSLRGLDSAARGLTPEDDWRAVFPRRTAAR